MSTFPKHFLWGAATASYQVEGGIENCDWAQAAREGRVPVCGRACDHYNRFREDFDLAKSLGHNAHRFSVEWARIEPEEGKFDEAAIEHYREVLRALRERGLEPFLTLHHFTLPLWFSQTGGWERADASAVFARYAEYVARHTSDLCTRFSTMNEPNGVVSNGWLRGTWPPFKRFPLIDYVSITNSGSVNETKPLRTWKALWFYFSVANTLARAHNAAYDAIKRAAPEADVSIDIHFILFHATQNPLYRLLARIVAWNWMYRFMNRVGHKLDSLGVHYYLQKKYGGTEVYEKTDMDWDIYPEGLYRALKDLARYRVPMYVTEAGCADAADRFRASYIEHSIAAVKKVLDEGIDVRGFLYWSLLDNYEWALGFEKRFGLIEIDYETLERHVRPSAYVYKQLIEKYSA